MPYPPFADIETNYTAFQQGQGDNSFPGQQVDTDLANLAYSVDTLNEFVRGFSRSDGEVGNQTIGHDQLKPELSIGLAPPTTWTTATAYEAGDTVFVDLAYYRATADHTSSGSFATDLNAGLWEVLIDFESSLTEGIEEIVEPIVEGLVPGISEDVLAQVPAVVAPMIAAATEDLEEDLLEQLIVAEDVTVNIPSDFSTLQAAVDFHSARVCKQGARITLNIESGHQPATGLLVQNGDYSRFYITSTDAEVDLASGFVGVVAPPDGGSTITSGTFIMAINAAGPVLGTIIDANGAAGARTGYFALRNATGRADRPAAPTEEEPVLPPIAGCKNFLHANAQAQECSTLVWENAVATGSGLNGIYAERASIIHAEFTDASNAAGAGFVAARGSTITASTAKANGCRIGFWALRACTINADDSEATACEDYGYYSSFGSTINAHSSDANGTLATGDDATFGGTGYLAYHGSRINATGADASGCVKYGAVARGMSMIEIDSADLTACGTSGVYATDGSTIQVESSDASTAGGNAIDADGASAINANGVTATGAGASAVRSRSGARVNAENATLTGATAHGVFADLGASINAAGANVSGSTSDEVRVNHGSFINISNGTTSAGSPGVPQAADTNVGALNTLSGNGVVFHIT
jgi:hypothetical protein